MRSGFTLLELCVVLVIILTLLALLAGPPFAVGLVKVTFLLAFGWILFLIRVLREMEWSSLGWMIATIALAATLVMSQRLAAKAIMRSPFESVSAWPFQRTARLIGIFLAACVCGVCLVGGAHEVSWLANAKEPMLRLASGRRVVRRLQSANNLKQIGIALHNYHDTHQTFPPGGTFDETGRGRHSWITAILPYIDQAPLTRQIDFSRPWSDSRNRNAFVTPIHVLLQPNPDLTRSVGPMKLAAAHYAANSRVLSADNFIRVSDIRDGTTNTILAGEVRDHIRAWGDPGNWRDPQLGINRSLDGFGSGVAVGGMQFLFADGAVRFVSENIDPKILSALATPNGGEQVQDY